MGRYLDLLNSRPNPGASAVPTCNKSDISDKRVSPNDLRSLMSLLSHSHLSRDDPATGQHKLTKADGEGWSAADWQAFFAERAAIAEFSGGLPRAEAEARAFACCVAEWLNRYFVPASPGRCLGCGKANGAHEPLLPFGTDRIGFVWLHSRCWSAWSDGRKAEAVAALAVMGIGHPAW